MSPQEMSSIPKDMESMSSLPDEASRPHPCDYPPSRPSRIIYLAFRASSVVLGLVLIVLSVLGKLLYNKPVWLGILLSVGLDSFCMSLVDFCVIIFANRRYHPWQRILQDGVLGIGYAVAIGFMVKCSLEELHEGGGPAAIAKVALLIMGKDMLIHFGFSFSGVLALRRSRRVSC